MVQNIIIGTPLVSLKTLGIDVETQTTAFDNERCLPKLLVKYGFISSVSELRRNRQDLIRELRKTDMELIKIGKKKVWIVIGK